MMKNMHSLALDLEQGLTEIPMFDVHTHLIGGKLGARGLHDVLLYHMVVTDLFSAGCPRSSRLTAFPGEASREEAHERIENAIPFLPHIRNTSCYWIVRIILADLYDWREPITADNWKKLDAMIRERADDRAWHHGVWDRLNIRRTSAEWARRGAGEDDDRLQYTLEWGFFTRTNWGQYDTALYELERCWGRNPESPSPITSEVRPPADRTIRTLDDVKAAMDHYINIIPYDQVISTATHISSDVNFREVSDDEMAAALKRRDQAGPEERDIYCSYLDELHLTGLEKHSDQIVYQFSYAAESLPSEGASRCSQRSIGQVSEIVARHPNLRFQCYLASRHANQALCTAARQLPNLSLAGYWWHNFFPDIMKQVMAERLDMLPSNKQIGFFSDSYCIEWSYGKAVVVRKLLAEVFAQKILEGQYTEEEAISIARSILYESPQTLVGMEPAETTV